MPIHFERIVDVWLLDQQGQRIQPMDEQDVLSIVGSAVVNGWGVIEITFSGRCASPSLLTIDNRFRIWFGTCENNMKPLAQTEWLIRKWESQIQVTDSGVELVLVITAVQAPEILDRRVVAYDAGSSQADKTGLGDDVMKAVVRENHGTLATDPDRNISAYMDVEADTAKGVSIEKQFEWRNSLLVLQEMAETSLTKKLPLFFDVVTNPGAAPGSPTLTFRTYTIVRGTVRTVDRTDFDPVVFSVENDNIKRMLLSQDYLNEINFIYAGGQGEEDERIIETASDPVRIGTSPLNRREGFTDGKNVSDPAALKDDAEAELALGQPIRVFEVEVKDTAGYRFMEDWDLGDKVNALSSDGVLYACFILAVTFRITPTQFVINAILRIEEFVEAL